MRHFDEMQTVFAGLLPWVQEQDPTRTYDYQDTSGCAVCQYFKALGFEAVSASGTDVECAVDGLTRSIRLPGDISLALVALDEQEATFGSLANRLATLPREVSR